MKYIKGHDASDLLIAPPDLLSILFHPVLCLGKVAYVNCISGFS
jgi:hypothetical protein